MKVDGQVYKRNRRHLRLQPREREELLIGASETEDEDEGEEETRGERTQEGGSSVSREILGKHQPGTRTRSGRISKPPQRYGWD